MTDGMNGEQWGWKDFTYRDEIPKTEFSAEHLDIFRQHTDRWKREAYSNQPIDKSKAKEAINALYRLEYRATPIVIWTKSPLANIFTKILFDEILCLNSPERIYSGLVTKDKILWDNIGPSVIATVNELTTDFSVVNREALEDISKTGSLWKAFGYMDDQSADAFNSIINDGLHHAIRLSDDFLTPLSNDPIVGDDIWSDICETIKAALEISPLDISDKAYVDETRQQLSACLRAMPEAYGTWNFKKNDPETTFEDSYVSRKIWSAKGDHCYSQFNLAKLSEYKCLADTHLIPRVDKLEHLYNLCLSTGWVLPSQKACFVSARPKILRVDERGLPHCEDGPAIKYPDGFSIYAWHGVRVPKRWTQEKPTPAEAMNTINAEQRRVACEVVGWDYIVDEYGAETIDKNVDPEIGELIWVTLPASKPEKFLRVKCGTGRDFVIPVPPEMMTALQANAWTWGLDILDDALA